MKDELRQLLFKPAVQKATSFQARGKEERKYVKQKYIKQYDMDCLER